MLEFITMKDPHFSFGFQNRIRNGYEKHIQAKLGFVQGYCQENAVNKILFTGDVFDSSKEDVWSFKKYRKNKRILEMFKNVGIELFSNVGNHDMFHGYENSEETIFGEMVHDGILNNVTENPIVVTEGNVVVKVQGIDYSNEDNIVLENIRQFDEEAYPGYKVFKIAVLHSNITPSEVSHVTDFTYASLATKFSDIDMFICGHYHIGYETTTLKRVDGKDVIFINNWNFTRVVRDYEVELDEHSPEFEHVVINYDKITEQFIVTTKNIKVPFVPYKEAFASKIVDLLKKSKKEIFNFFDNINFDDVKEDSRSSDEELFKKIQEKNGFSDEAVLEATTYLNNAKD